MKKRTIIVLLFTMILYISLANACQSIPENYYKFLNLDETISLSNYIVVVEKVKDGPSIGLFPSLC